MGPAAPHRRLLGGVQHGRQLLPHLVGHREAWAHLPFHVQLAGAHGHHRPRLDAARHRRLRGQPARSHAHRRRALRLPLGQRQGDDGHADAAAAGHDGSSPEH
uniref:Uncharacterized protein n=1 Tax=Arundo donax TaxID=35708 RepID=A0A0A9AS20_ARUDO